MEAYIIEDEPYAMASLKQLIEIVSPEVKVVNTANTLIEGISIIQRKIPDLIFLDIQLGNEKCFDLIKYFDDLELNIIFVTAFDHYALEAFKWNALHYITKPIISSELKEGINRAKKRVGSVSKEQIEAFQVQLKSQQRPSSITLRYNSIIDPQPLDQIIRLQSDGGITVFYCLTSPFGIKGGQIKRKAVSRHLGYYEKLLPSDFFRCHQSHLINRAFIKYYDRSEHTVHLLDSSQVPVAKQKRELFMNWL